MSALMPLLAVVFHGIIASGGVFGCGFPPAPPPPPPAPAPCCPCAAPPPPPPPPCPAPCGGGCRLRGSLAMSMARRRFSSLRSMFWRHKRAIDSAPSPPTRATSINGSTPCPRGDWSAPMQEAMNLDDPYQSVHSIQAALFNNFEHSDGTNKKFLVTCAHPQAFGNDGSSESVGDEQELVIPRGLKLISAGDQFCNVQVVRDARTNRNRELDDDDGSVRQQSLWCQAVAIVA